MDWHCLFVLPFWLQTVRHHLTTAADPHIVTVTEGQKLIGIVPLEIENDTARFIGRYEVSDYQDIVTAPGRQLSVMQAVVEHLQRQGIRRLDLRTLRPDALTLDAISKLADQRNCDLVLSEDEATFETDLPADWEGYLLQLSGKQRHEVRRKARRLENYGAFCYRMAINNGHMQQGIDNFLHLFRSNRRDKQQFMQGPMEAYFRDLITGLAEQRMLRLYFLDLDDKPVATVLCFDYKGVRYLYNSGYDEQYEELSVGVLSKVFSIRAGIEGGCRKFDFLKGAEEYKRRIGGTRIPLYRALVQI